MLLKNMLFTVGIFDLTQRYLTSYADQDVINELRLIKILKT